MNTKEKIAKEAAILFATNGYASSSIRNIANQVGIRESAIYNHFNSKKAILDSILDNASDLIGCKNLLTDEIINNLTAPQIFLQIFTNNLFEVWQQEDEKLIFTIIFKEESNLELEKNLNFSSYISNLNGLLELVFNQMMKHGFISESDSQKLAEFFFSPLVLFRINNLLFGKEISDKMLTNYIDHHVDQFQNIIEIR